MASLSFSRLNLFQCLLLLFGSNSVKSFVLLEPRTVLFFQLYELLDPSISSLCQILLISMFMLSNGRPILNLSSSFKVLKLRFFSFLDLSLLLIVLFFEALMLILSCLEVLYEFLTFFLAYKFSLFIYMVLFDPFLCLFTIFLLNLLD